jgi:hypothetical protein
VQVVPGGHQQRAGQHVVRRDPAHANGKATHAEAGR